MSPLPVAPPADRTRLRAGLAGAAFLCLAAVSLAPARAHTPGHTAADGTVGLTYGIEISVIDFDEEFFAGNVGGLSAYLGIAFDYRYEVGLRFHTDFIPTASLDRGEELTEDDELIDLTASMLYLRRNWRVADHTLGYAMIGYSRVELEEDEFVGCSIFFLCTPVTRTTYRNRESGLAFGFGMSWFINEGVDATLGYIDYSDSDLDYRGLHFGIGYRTNW